MVKSGYLPWIILAVVGLVVMSVVTTGALQKTPFLTDATSEVETSRAQSLAHARENHFVAPRQLADSNAMIDRAVNDFRAVDQDGRSLDWNELSGGRPVVLVFVKHGCPCSGTFEPFFQRVERLYHGVVRFADVIDGPTESAPQHAAEHQTPYPVLSDPERGLIRRFQAKNGGYFVLLTPNGVIDGCWPGCSRETLQELGRRIAQRVGLEERPLDVFEMPRALTTGCPFGS
jgi:peroxiredoxin